MPQRSTTRTVTVAVVLAGALTLAGCGVEDAEPAPSPSDTSSPSASASATVEPTETADPTEGIEACPVLSREELGEVTGLEFGVSDASQQGNTSGTVCVWQNDDSTYAIEVAIRPAEQENMDELVQVFEDAFPVVEYDGTLAYAEGIDVGVGLVIGPGRTAATVQGDTFVQVTASGEEITREQLEVTMALTLAELAARDAA